MSGQLAAALVASLDDAALDRLAEQLAPRIAARLAPPERDEWLDAHGAAAYLGITTAALHRRTTRAARTDPDAIPFHQDAPGCKLWFLRSELDEWRRSR